jgi:hypothetical protein
MMQASPREIAADPASMIKPERLLHNPAGGAISECLWMENNDAGGFFLEGSIIL